jgi:membrane-associated phospholipid phosphatase
MPPASRWPKDGGAIDRLDKLLSAPIFSLQIGLALESICSIPGCFFGMPAFHVISPVLVACAVGECSETSDVAASLFGGTSLLLVAIWYRVLFPPAGTSGPKKMLYSAPTLVLAPVWGCVLLRLVTTSATARGAAYFHLAAWFLSIIPVLGLKGAARRRRPVVCPKEAVGVSVAVAQSRKALQSIPRMLHEDGNASFPSGDVAGAVSFAYPLVMCGGSAPLAAACVALSAFGRVYWQAHHLLDVTCGGLISLGACALLEAGLAASANQSADLPACTLAARWHVAAALVSLVVFAKATKAQDNAPAQK